MIDFTKYSKESCYFAGVIAGDGCVIDIPYESGKNGTWKRGYVRLSYKIAIKDKQLFNLVSEAFGFTYTTIRTHKNRDCFPKQKNPNKIFTSIQGHINGRAIVDCLGKMWGIIPRKTAIYKPPMQMPENFVSHFIRGLLDSDGTVYWRKPSGHCKGGTITYQFLGTKDICQWVADCVRKYINPKFKGQPGQAKREDGSPCWRVYIASKSIAKPLTKWIYKDSTSQTRLIRKYDKAIQYEKQTIIYPHVNPPKSPKRKLFTLEQEKEISKLYMDGFNSSELGKKFRCSTGTIINILKREGIKSRTKNQALKLVWKNKKQDRVVSPA